jgi:hypothetical protein
MATWMTWKCLVVAVGYLASLAMIQRHLQHCVDLDAGEFLQ